MSAGSRLEYSGWKGGGYCDDGRQGFEGNEFEFDEGCGGGAGRPTKTLCELLLLVCGESGDDAVSLESSLFDKF